MSTFITTADYEASIPADLLTRITRGNSAILDDCENMAIELMRGYLSARYDVAAIFGAAGSARNPLVVKYAVDIALYYAYHRLETDEVPEMRRQNYEAAERWLRRVQEQEVNPPDLPLVTDGTKDYVLFGSNTRRQNHLN